MNFACIIEKNRHTKAVLHCLTTKNLYLELYKVVFVALFIWKMRKKYLWLILKESVQGEKTFCPCCVFWCDLLIFVIIFEFYLAATSLIASTATLKKNLLIVRNKISRQYSL